MCPFSFQAIPAKLSGLTGLATQPETTDCLRGSCREKCHLFTPFPPCPTTLMQPFGPQDRLLSVFPGSVNAFSSFSVFRLRALAFVSRALDILSHLTHHLSANAIRSTLKLCHKLRHLSTFSSPVLVRAVPSLARPAQWPHDGSSLSTLTLSGLFFTKGQRSPDVNQALLPLRSSLPAGRFQSFHLPALTSVGGHLIQHQIKALES